MGDDVSVRSVDVFVFLDEVGAQNGAEELWGSDRVLLGEDVDGVLDRVSSDNDAVVGLSVAVVDLRLVPFVRLCALDSDSRSLNLSLQQHTDGHLHHRLHTGLLVPVDLVDTDIVLSVASSSDRGRHFDQ